MGRAAAGRGTHLTTMHAWTIRDSLELYNLQNWGRGFFGVNESGQVEVRPRGEGGPAIALPALVEDLRQRGLRTPMLLRFPDILNARVRRLAEAFRSASSAYSYNGKFRGVYPIKVNQQRRVVEELVEFGAQHGIGLEAGSKPELLIALALLDTPNALIICNGYKDRAYIETALLAQRLGRTPVIVIDRFHEIELVVKVASELGIKPHVGIRAKLQSKGAGKWIDSTGDKSKFGLTASEIVEAVEQLRASDMLDCLELLHFHIGSQITAIRAHKDALREATRIFVGLHELGAKPRILDVGGGLGVDYDGSQTNFHSSKNYTVQEYANDVVASIQEACDGAGVPHPDIVTEAGRWMVAHHALLVFDVLGASEVRIGRKPEAMKDDDPKVLKDLHEVWQGVNKKNVIESFHDAMQIKEDAATLFNVGQLDLRARARVERMFWDCCEKIMKIASELKETPEELEDLEKGLADTYYGNLSVFQSVPDHWAVKQLFPVMPIQRLNEKPSRRAIIADLTCDSDGKIDQFIDQHDVKNVLELHSLDGRRYYIAVFMVGAYQEILGDLHNLFGDTDAVHVVVDDESGGYIVDHVVEGEDVKDVLTYVEYDQAALTEKVRRLAEDARRRGDITIEEATRLRARYKQGLWEYTYLIQDS
ncbi:MAG TPA: biosynthetic arginine decarboxylase [Myxococcota bacterium]|nr:biosynthetic arginine decarboxylase [Myxococcota bacterium]